MQQLSYDPNDPFFTIDGWQLAVQIITFENVYGLDPEATQVATSADGTTITCSGLTWAGGQERCEGSVRIDVRRADDGIEVAVTAQHTQTIRCVKLIVRDVPAGDVVGAFWGTSKVPPGGLVLSYPTPLHTPLVFVSPKVGKAAYFQSLDSRVRAKRFAFYERDGVRIAELIYEGLATEPSTSVETPPWRIGRTGDPGSIAEQHRGHVEAAFGLEPWETRSDIPAWTRDVALVVALHGMHWSGRIFNTYESMLAALRWTAERIEGRRVLAFLPGWEGRYYWQYGDYRPEPRLGGEDGFRRFVDGARELGVHLMPMFGANCVNANLPGFEEWGRPAVIRSASGLEFQGNRPDWDTARAHDPGWQAWLNPGMPSWRARLADQIAGLVERYDLPALFLDTQQVWVNDPNFAMYDGLRALRDELKARHPNLLVAGEGWYDALGAITPVSQAGAPVRWPQLFSRYCRTFQHLSAGDPGRGSTGVHELGENPFREAPDEPHYWPTVTIVDGTIEQAASAVERVIVQARRYADKYLS